MKKIYFILFILLTSLSFVSSAHWIVGYVENADDGTLPENYTAIISNSQNFIDNVTDTIGIYGNSGTDNVYMIDCELLSSGCSTGDNLYVKVIKNSLNYSNVKSVGVTSSGYDIAPNLKLYSLSEFINIIFPINNSYLKNGLFTINTTMNSVDSCRYSINNTQNITMSTVKDYGIVSSGNSFYTGGGGTSSPSAMTDYNNYIYIIDKYDKEVYKYYENLSFTKQSFSIVSSGINSPNGITTDGTYFYITDSKTGSDYIFKYYLNGTYINNFALDVNNDNSYDLTTNGTYIWITDSGVNTIFKYYTNGTLVSYKTISQLPRGITSNSTNLFVVGWADDNIKTYDYDMNYAGENYSLGSFIGLFGICTDNSNIWTLEGTSTFKKRTMNGTEISSASTFNSSYPDNLDPTGITTNGSIFWVADYTSGYLYKYSLSGTYLNKSINTVANSVSNNISNIFTLNKPQSKIYVFLSNGTYTGVNFSTVSSPNGLWCNSTKCLTMSTDTIYSYYTNGTLIGADFSLDSNNIDPKDLFRDNVYTYVSDGSDNAIYKYYNDGTLDSIYNITYGNIYGLGGNSTNLFSTDRYSNQIIFYDTYKDTNVYNATNNSLLDGIYNILFNCNDTSNNFIFSNLNYFTIDNTYPQISIGTITTTTGSQTISFNPSITELNSGTCKYSIYKNGIIDGINQNVSFICGNQTLATVSSYSTFTLRIYSTDLAGNQNYTEENFTTVPAPSTGGGGGGSSTPLILSESFKLTTLTGQDYLDFFLPTSSSAPREIYFIITNTGGSEVNLKLSCQDYKDDSTINKSTGDISICDYITLPNETITVNPNENDPKTLSFKISPQENATLGETYYFNIIAKTDKEYADLSSKATTSFVGEFYKSYSIGSGEDKRTFPLTLTLIIIGLLMWIFITSILSTKLFGKKFGLGLFLGFLAFLMILVLGVLLIKA